MTHAALNIGTYDNDPLNIPIEALLTGRTGVVGMSGSGKSHLIGVLCEELCESNSPFIIIDTEGEYKSLKERYEVIWACNDPSADLKLSMANCEKLAEVVVNQGARLIFDTSESSNEFDIVSNFLKHFYEFQSKIREPILLIVEEADRFVPQSHGTDVKELHEISRRGRKRGIGLIIATQRPAMVDKNVLSQCGNQLIGRLRTKNDSAAVKLFFHNSQDLKSLPDLERGTFFIMGDISPTPQQVNVKDRKTSHGGTTPKSSEKKRFDVQSFKSSFEGVIHSIPGVERPEERANIEPASNNAEIEPKGMEIEPIDSIEDEPPTPEKAKKGTASKKDKTSSTKPKKEIYGIEFKLTTEEALDISQQRSLKSIPFIGKSNESIERCEAVLWPMLVCKIETAKRGLFGLNVKKMDAIWDCVSGAFVKIDDNYDIREIENFDDKVSALSWKEIRALRELAKADLTINDIAPKTSLSVGEIKSAVSSLSKKNIVRTCGKAGRANIYRPSLRISSPSLRDIRTKIPVSTSVEPQMSFRDISPIFEEEAVTNIVKGFFEDTDVPNSELFYMPFFIIYLRGKRRGELRILQVNGVTGASNELHKDMAESKL